MEKEVVSILANVVIAFSTFIGVGGAVAYYMKEIRDSSMITIILTEIIYILVTVIILGLIKGKLEKEN